MPNIKCQNSEHSLGLGRFYHWLLGRGLNMKEGRGAASANYCFWGRINHIDKGIVSLKDMTVKGKKEITGEIQDPIETEEK